MTHPEQDPKEQDAVDESQEISEDELDQAAGGYELKNVMISSYQVSGSTAEYQDPNHKPMRKKPGR